MNVRKKEGRSMRRNNYLPVTRDPQFKVSLSLLALSICQTSHRGKSLKGSADRERERGTWGWETASLTPRTCWWLCSDAAALLARSSVGRQDRDSELGDSGPPNP